jgi:flagellar operon protein
MTPLPHNPALVPPVGAPAGGRVDIPTRPGSGAPGVPATPNGPSFADVLGEKSGAVQLSGHAKARIERRGIDLDSKTLARLQHGVDRAAAKGSRESVVLVDDVAFVVSVKARTVITAVDRASMRDHVFTNIDSAVIS